MFSLARLAALGLFIVGLASGCDSSDEPTPDDLGTAAATYSVLLRAQNHLGLRLPGGLSRLVARLGANVNEFGLLTVPAETTLEVVDADGGVFGSATRTLADGDDRVSVQL